MAEGRPAVIRAADVPPRTGSSYPAAFAKDVEGRAKRALGDQFGLAVEAGVVLLHQVDQLLVIAEIHVAQLRVPVEPQRPGDEGVELLLVRLDLLGPDLSRTRL